MHMVESKKQEGAPAVAKELADDDAFVLKNTAAWDWRRALIDNPPAMRELIQLYARKGRFRFFPLRSVRSRAASVATAHALRVRCGAGPPPGRQRSIGREAPEGAPVGGGRVAAGACQPGPGGPRRSPFAQSRWRGV